MPKLSHSAVSRYNMCGQNYKYHYIDRIRPTIHSAALVFGSAFDSAVNVLLTASEEEAEAVFESSFRENEINSVKVDIPTYERLIYSNSDFDIDLLISDDFEEIDQAIKTGKIKFKSRHHEESFNEIKVKKKLTGWDNVSSEEKVFYNYMNWLCLRRKGLLMIEAYRKQVMPKIINVLSVQEPINLDNGHGDVITGFVDLIAEIKGHGIVILDNKTSSMEYDKDSVLVSPQLSTYVHALGDKYNTRKGGYIVVHKQVIKNTKKICKKCGNDGSGGRHDTCDAKIEGKRCHGEWERTFKPEIRIQFIIDEIPLQTENIVLENYDNVNNGIKNGVFPRNFSVCDNMYGSKCPYYNLCYYNKKDGLEQK